jgi:general secretion pathway protein K
VAIVAVAVLTALVVDLVYQTRVRLQIAANARDDLRAEALAHSAVAMSRLVLSFQNQIDQTMSAVSAPQASAGASGATGATGASGATSPASPFPRPQLWNLVPVSTALTDSLFPAAGAPGAPAAARAAGGPSAVPETSFGDFQGGFDARIDDEGQKVNVQLDALAQSSGILSAQVEAVLRMVCDARWDPLFDRTDAEGQRTSRADLVTNLRNWVVSDTGSASLHASFPAGNCSLIVGQPAFEAGFSDKNYAYDRGPDRYRTKNAPMDSVRELHMVAGVSDAFMAAFGDQLTVYLSKNSGGINVNAHEPRRQIAIAKLFLENGAQSMLDDPEMQKKLVKAVSEVTYGGFATITPLQFAQLLQAAPLNLPVRKEYLSSSTKSPFTDRSLVFGIHARGVAGDVTHQTEAVVTFDPDQIPLSDRAAQGTSLQAGQLDMGQLIHWRED